MRACIEKEINEQGEAEQRKEKEVVQKKGEAEKEAAEK